MARRTATRALGRADAETVQERCTFSPRSYQKRVQEAWRAGARFLVTVWPRRSGKDKVWTAIALEGLLRRPGLYLHIFPTLALARKALWDASSDGTRHRDLFPHEIVVAVNETELQITFANGSIWQLLGAEDPDSLRGLNPYGVVLSEYSEMSEETWRVLSPILAENHGWIAFNFTPKGRNHAYRLYMLSRERVAAEDTAWFSSKLTVDEVRRDGIGEGGGEVIPAEEIARERQHGMPEEFVQQEYFTSFDASLVGSYYGAALRQAEAAGRITRVAWHPTTPVITAWDLGFDDYTAVWFVQPVGRELRVIDYHEAEGEWIPYYAKVLKEREYAYEEHLLPHDAEADNIRGDTIQNQLRALKVGRTRIVPKESVEIGIQAVRALFPKLVFDEVRTQLGRERLAAYRKDKNADGYYKAKPKHDQASDAADALRTLAMGLRVRSDTPMQTRAASATSDPYGDGRAMAKYAESGTRTW